MLFNFDSLFTNLNGLSHHCLALCSQVLPSLLAKVLPPRSIYCITFHAAPLPLSSPFKSRSHDPIHHPMSSLYRPPKSPAVIPYVVQPPPPGKPSPYPQIHPYPNSSYTASPTHARSSNLHLIRVRMSEFSLLKSDIGSHIHRSSSSKVPRTPKDPSVPWMSKGGSAFSVKVNHETKIKGLSK